jgi:hypothetical protein
MAYESDPAGIGVGKTYGPQHLNSAGVVKTEGTNEEAVFELNIDGGGGIAATYTVSLPAYAIIREAYTEVTEVFDGPTPGYTLTLDGGTATAEQSLGTLGIFANDLSTGSPTLVTDADGGDLVLTPDAAAIAGTAGVAKVVVSYTTL